MNDYNEERCANDSQKMRQAEYAAMSLSGGRAGAGSIVGGNEPPAMLVLGNIFERANKLAAMAEDHANRIAGTQPQPSEAGAKLESDPMTNLRSAVRAIENALTRVDQHLGRAMNSL